MSLFNVFYKRVETDSKDKMTVFAKDPAAAQKRVREIEEEKGNTIRFIKVKVAKDKVENLKINGKPMSDEPSIA